MRILKLTKETLVLIVAALLGVTLVGVLIARTSEAIFSGSTVNPNNSWATGSVSIGDDSGGVAMFNATGLGGGNVLTKCIRVTYTGSAVAATNVKFYATGLVDGGLAPYLNVRVEQSNNGNGSYADCGTFSGTQIFNDTLTKLTTDNSSFGAGLGTFAPTATNQYSVYRFTVTTSSVAAAQAKSASVNFAWEAQG